MTTTETNEALTKLILELAKMQRNFDEIEVQLHEFKYNLIELKEALIDSNGI